MSLSPPSLTAGAPAVLTSSTPPYFPSGHISAEPLHTCTLAHHRGHLLPHVALPPAAIRPQKAIRGCLPSLPPNRCKVPFVKLPSEAQLAAPGAGTGPRPGHLLRSFAGTGWSSPAPLSCPQVIPRPCLVLPASLCYSYLCSDTARGSPGLEKHGSLPVRVCVCVCVCVCVNGAAVR